ncbi:MAG: hypothetical protein WC867_06355 [Candidatus Pacearchaeota archaeon]|jgi:metal-responsive CopG/Arc/MetJ family transcriptional regulator
MPNKLAKEGNSSVKIDAILLNEIDELIKKEEHKFRFVNKKQFIDVAVHEFLQKLKKEEKNEK